MLVPPAPVIRGLQQAHPNNGRVQKICSNSASLVTALFLHRMSELKPGVVTPELLPTFDCRIGAFKGKEEALALLWWRVQDCGMNAISDAVFHLQGPPKSGKTDGTDVKLAQLKEAGKLPMHEHQAHGSFFVKVKRRKEGFNPKTQKAVVCYRPMLEKVTGNVLVCAARGALPADAAEVAPPVAGE